MSEYLIQQGRRVELHQELLKKKTLAKGLRDSLRLELDPVAEIETLNEEQIMILAAQLSEVLGDISEIEAKLAAIVKIIGK